MLRYDKRTRVHPGPCQADPAFTVRQETVEDAAMAVSLAASQPGIDPSRVFLLGHSLGGYLLPRLANAAPGCAGYISLAGSARPLEVLILEQSRRQGAPPEALARIQAEVKRLQALDAASTAPILGAPPSYWLDLKAYDPPREARNIRKPMFFLQGEKDCQVTLDDFERWKAALGTRADVAWKRYAGLNHLFMGVEGVSTGAEYFKVGQHVDTVVVDDLAAWIRGRLVDVR